MVNFAHGDNSVAQHRLPGLSFWIITSVIARVYHIRIYSQKWLERIKAENFPIIKYNLDRIKLFCRNTAMLVMSSPGNCQGAELNSRTPLVKWKHLVSTSQMKSFYTCEQNFGRTFALWKTVISLPQGARIHLACFHSKKWPRNLLRFLLKHAANNRDLNTFLSTTHLRYFLLVIMWGIFTSAVTKRIIEWVLQLYRS